jgi:hypothetical protein
MSLAETLKTLKYQVPKGKIDIPYTYVYDATALTDGVTYAANTSGVTTNLQGGLTLQLDSDSDFILRRICGASLCSGTFRPYYATRMLMFQNLVRSVANWPVLPEVLYPANSQILFDLGVVNRAFNVANAEPRIYTSYLAFQGVRRYDVSKFPVYRTPYNYRELPRNYTYVLRPGSGWTDAVNGIKSAPITISVPLLEGDFELLSIGVVDLQTFAPPTINAFQLRLYDGTGYNKLSDPGLNLFYFNTLAPQVAATPAVNAWYRPIYPTPSVVYPENGGIKFEIQSLLPFANAANAYQINFYGIQRQRNSTGV